MVLLNGLKAEPGERFTVASGEEFEIRKIEGRVAYVAEIKSGRVFSYGVDALKRLFLKGEQNVRQIGF